MFMVVDVNILIAALVRDGAARRLLMMHTCCLPETALRGIDKYSHYIMEKAHLTPSGFRELLVRVLAPIELVAFAEYEHRMKEAGDIMNKIDPGDTQFVALCLHRNMPVWSDDNDFQRQNAVKVFTTKQIFSRFA